MTRARGPRSTERAGVDRTGTRVRDQRALARFAGVLVVLAGSLGIALAATGQAWPPLGLLALFAALAWFAVNRYTFFPSEMSVTAESAVLLASVVVFRRDAPLLGPWCVAVLVGPLDALHWEHRAFSRMAYNAAHQVLAVVAAALAFDALLASGRHSVVEFLGASIAAAVTFLAVVLLAGIGVLHVYAGYAPRSALRHLLALDWTILPLGVLGAAAGQAALTRGLWVLPLVLVPAAFLPELGLGRVRWLLAGPGPRAADRRLWVVGAVVGVGVFAAPASILAGTDGVLVVALAGLAVLVGAELRVGRAVIVPPVVAVLLVLSLAAEHGDRGLVALVASAATALAVLVAGASGRATRWRTLWAAFIAFVVAGAVGTVAALGIDGAAWWSAERVLAALAAGVVSAVITSFATGSGARRLAPTRVLWLVPLFAVVAVAGLGVVRFGLVGALAGAVVLPGAAVLVVVWAAPPWPSALLGAAVAKLQMQHRPGVLLGIGTAGLAAAVATTAVTNADLRAATALIALGVLELCLALAATGAFQWRFAPRRRAIDGALVALTAAALLVGYPTLTQHDAVAATLVAALGLAVVLFVGLAPARCSDEAATHPSTDVGA